MMNDFERKKMLYKALQHFVNDELQDIIQATYEYDEDEEKFNCISADEEYWYRLLVPFDKSKYCSLAAFGFDTGYDECSWCLSISRSKLDTIMGC